MAQRYIKCNNMEIVAYQDFVTIREVVRMRDSRPNQIKALTQILRMGYGINAQDALDRIKESLYYQRAETQ